MSDKYKLLNAPLAKQLKPTPKKIPKSNYNEFIKNYNKTDSKNLKNIVRKLTRDKFNKDRNGNKHRRKAKSRSTRSSRSTKSNIKPKIVVTKIPDILPNPLPKRKVR